MVKKSYQERVREQRELDILRIASHMVHEHGYTNLNMDDLANEVGISKSTLYQHFSSKEDMVIRVLLRSVDVLEAHMEQSSGSSLERLEQLMRHILHTATSPDSFATILMRDDVMTLFHTHTAMRPRINQCYVVLNQWIDDAKAQGDIRTDIHNSVIVSSMFGLLGVVDSPDILRDTLDTDTMINQTVALWLRGIRTTDTAHSHSSSEPSETL